MTVELAADLQVICDDAKPAGVVDAQPFPIASRQSFKLPRVELSDTELLRNDLTVYQCGILEFKGLE